MAEDYRRYAPVASAADAASASASRRVGLTVELVLVLLGLLGAQHVTCTGILFSSSHTQVTLTSSGSSTVGYYEGQTMWPPVTDPNRISVDLNYIRLLSHVALTLDEFRVNENDRTLFNIEPHVDSAVLGLPAEGHSSSGRTSITTRIHTHVTYRNSIITASGEITEGVQQPIQIERGMVHLEWTFTNSTTYHCGQCFTTIELGLTLHGRYQPEAPRLQPAEVKDAATEGQATVTYREGVTYVDFYGATVIFPQTYKKDNEWFHPHTQVASIVPEGNNANVNIRLPHFLSATSYSFYLKLKPPVMEEDEVAANQDDIEDPNVVSLSSAGDIDLGELEHDDSDDSVDSDDANSDVDDDDNSVIQDDDGSRDDVSDHKPDSKYHRDIETVAARDASDNSSVTIYRSHYVHLIVICVCVCLLV